MFITLGKAGGSAMADAEAMGRLISLALRSGIPLMSVHKQLRGISSDRAVGLGPNKVLSVPDAIGIALDEWHQDKQGVQQELLRGRLASIRRSSQRRPCATPVVVPVSGQGGAQAEAEEYRRRQQVLHWHLSGLRFAAGVRGGMREVSRVWI